MKGTGWDGGLMLSLIARLLLVVLLAVTAAGCAAIAGIFKAGFWVGIIVAGDRRRRDLRVNEAMTP